MSTLPWEMIGAIFGGLSVILTLILEWQKLRRIGRTIGLKPVIIASLIGISVFGSIMLIQKIFYPPSPPINITPIVEKILPTPTGKLLFNDDFESGMARNFNFYQGNWVVVDDGAGNKVLQNTTADGSSNAALGLDNFSDGTIELRFKIINVDYKAQNHVIELGFRNQAIYPNGNWTEYIAVFDPAAPPSLNLVYQENSGSWQPLEGVSGGGSIQVPPGWITLRVETQGSDIKVFIDGNLFITAYDSRARQGGLYFGELGNMVVQYDDFKVWNSTP